MRSNISDVSSHLTSLPKELFNGVSNSQNSSKSLVNSSTINGDASVENAVKDKLVKLEENKLELQKSEDKTINQEQLDAAIEIVSSFLQPRNVNFAYHESSGKTVVSIFDAESKELIKQFPSEKILNMADRIQGLQNEIASKTGMLFDDKV